MADKDTPVEEVLNMFQQGLSESDVIRTLSEEGYSPVQITDALNQAKIKKEISPEGLTPSIMSEQPPAPSSPEIPKPQVAVAPAPSPGPAVVPVADYQTYPYQYPTYDAQPQPKVETEIIEEIAEEIISEKWAEIKSKISDVIDWKIYAEKRISSVDERLKRIEMSLDRIQAAMLAKVQEYSRDIKDLGAEMSGLQGAFGKILTPFVENMKELSKITSEIKTAKQHFKKAMKKPKMKPQPKPLPKVVVQKVVPKIIPQVTPIHVPVKVHKVYTRKKKSEKKKSRSAPKHSHKLKRKITRTTIIEEK